jgi:hypothetical protein
MRCANSGKTWKRENCDASGSEKPQQIHDYVGPAGLYLTGHDEEERLLLIRLDQGEQER